MKWNDDRPTIRKLFSEMKREDSRHIPAFSRLISAQPVPMKPRRVFWIPAVTAAGFATAAVCWLLVSFHPQPARGPAARLAGETPIAAITLKQIQSLSTWEASSDTLLASSETAALTQYQATTDALLDAGMTDNAAMLAE